MISGSLVMQLKSDGCSGTHNEVIYLEQVQIALTLSSSRRGEIEIYLTSPMKTRSMLLAKRAKDSSSDGFKDWLFMTTHSWSELSVGDWSLEIKNGASSGTWVCLFFYFSKCENISIFSAIVLFLI